eukprot:6260438-Amphidinium_carterae.2
MSGPMRVRLCHDAYCSSLRVATRLQCKVHDESPSAGIVAATMATFPYLVLARRHGNVARGVRWSEYFESVVDPRIPNDNMTEGLRKTQTTHRVV